MKKKNVDKQTAFPSYDHFSSSKIDNMDVNNQSQISEHPGYTQCHRSKLTCNFIERKHHCKSAVETSIKTRRYSLPFFSKLIDENFYFFNHQSYHNLFFRRTSLILSRKIIPTCRIYSFLFVFLFFLLQLAPTQATDSDVTQGFSNEAKTVNGYKDETTVLTCSISQNPQLEVLWYKNDIPVKNERGKFKMQHRQLRIRHVRLSDSGVYTCRATNKLGKIEQLRFHLQVKDTEPSTFSPSRRKGSMKPIFSQPVQMRQHDFVKPEGGTAKFQCRAKGKPRPRIQWFKDGNKTGFNGNTKALWALKLRGLEEKDSGIYTCRVWNSVGTISFNYSLQVVSTEHEKPVLLEPHPLNTTVVDGEKTSLQCRVRSAVPPTITWIKRLDQDSLNAYNGKLPTNSLEIEDKFYLVLPAQEMMSFPDGTYLSKLVLKRTRLSDAGMYICLGANTKGFNYRYAYLAVNPALTYESDKLTIDDEFPLAVIIAVPAVAGLLIVSSVIYCCMRNQERLGQWSRDQEKLRQLKRSNLQYAANSRLSSTSSAGNVEAGMETQETVDTPVLQYTPESTIERMKDSGLSSEFSQSVIDSSTMSNYETPPSPPPPSQYSMVSSRTSSSKCSKNHHSCNHQNRRHHHHHHHHHRSQSHRKLTDSLTLLDDHHHQLGSGTHRSYA